VFLLKQTAQSHIHGGAKLLWDELETGPFQQAVGGNLSGAIVLLNTTNAA
jgi:hypothetical protein